MKIYIKFSNEREIPITKNEANTILKIKKLNSQKYYYL